MHASTFPGGVPNFQAVPQFTSWGGWSIDVSWGFLEKFLAQQSEDVAFDDDPDFQRAHVWTREQQIAFVEYKLRGGRTGGDILTNCPGWHVGSKLGPYELVDGKQRLRAVRMFLAGELPAFGHLRPAYGGVMRPTHLTFKWHVNDLATRADVLRWYLETNTGGTPHTADEIARVRALLAAEVSR